MRNTHNDLFHLAAESTYAGVRPVISLFPLASVEGGFQACAWRFRVRSWSSSTSRTGSPRSTWRVCGATSTWGSSTRTGAGCGPGDWVLIHVGFAHLQGRRGGGACRPGAARGHGRRLRAGARGAQGERDRVTRRARPTAHCITCGDDGVPMRVVRVDDAARARAVRGRRRRSAHGRDRAGRAGRAGRRRARTRRDVALVRTVKFVDEFRDAELGRAWPGRSSPPSSPAATTRSWRCAAGTRTRSTSTASTTCCRPTWSSSTGPAARCA